MKMLYTIAVGMCAGELCPPYSSSIPKERIEEFYRFLEDKEVIKCDSNVDAGVELDRLHKEGNKEVQIVGAWSQWCVASSVVYALIKGMTVHAPKSAIINAPGSFLPDLESTIAKCYVSYQREIEEGIDIYIPT